MRKLATSIFALAVSGMIATSASALTLKEIGALQMGEGEGFAEILRYSADAKAVYVTASETGTVEKVDLSDPTAPKKVMPLDLKGGDVTAVSVAGNMVAASIKMDPGTNGKLMVFDLNGKHLADFEAGDLPDNLAFSKDGRFLIAANEGEPTEDHSIDPEGSITVVDFKDGIDNAKVTQISLAGLEVPNGARIVRPGATFAVDAEPEYVTVSPNNKIGFVAIQEANALITVDLEKAEILTLTGLGFKNASNLMFDMSDKDGGINQNNWPVRMMYQPDTIAAYEVGGATYLITANEGDAKDYEGFSEETRVAKLTLDPVAYPNAADLQKKENLGRLKTTKTFGDTDGDGDTDIIYAYGGRSFSIFDAQGELVFDSGDELERIVKERAPKMFNINEKPEKFDERSDDKGLEPEAVTVGEIDGRIYAFIGMERNSGLFIYDVTNPAAPSFVDYIQPNAMHASPEGLDFVSAKDSPNGKPLLLGAFEVSGTIAVFEVTK